MLTRALFALTAGTTGCLSTDTSAPLEPLPAGGFHVLFIGNSLTYANGLPETLSRLGLAVKDTIRTADVSLPNYAVIDHAQGLGGSQAVPAIKLGDWDMVILQQGPTTTALNRDTLVLAAQLLDPLVRTAGGRTALMMTWPRSDQLNLFDAVSTSYQAAASAVGGVFLPVGEAWRAALAENPQFPLYSGDRFHPGPLGTYLAALVIYERITGHNPLDLPAEAVVAGQTLNVDAETIRFMQRIAHETVLRFPTP